MALHDRVVDLLDLAVVEGALELGVGALALGDDHEAARADVEAVHDAGALGGARGGDAEAGRGQRAEHGRARPSRPRDAPRRRPACRSRRCRHRRTRSRNRAPRSARPSAPPAASSHLEPGARASRSDLPRTHAVQRSRRRPRATSAANVREKPSSFASAASTRSPASPSGTGRLRDVHRPVLRRASVAGARCGRRSRRAFACARRRGRCRAATRMMNSPMLVTMKRCRRR